MPLPTVSIARQIALSVAGEAVHTCERFSTGLRNWVYDVELQSGRRIVVRLSDPEHRVELAGGVFWTDQLERLGVRVASVIAHDTDCAQPYMVLDRLAGTDLANVFETLDADQLHGIASGVARMQSQAALLPLASGFGYALSYGQPLEATWVAVLHEQLDRAQRWIEQAGVVDPALVAPVRDKLAADTGLFDGVGPTAFLHDATTKNVIVDNGRLSGLVDVDTMAFGDPLWAVALTRMSLYSAGWPTDYADMLSVAMGFEPDEPRLDLYTRIFCLTFLGELGQTFNQDTPPAVDLDHQRHLEALL